MKRNHRLINWFLLVILSVSFAMTASDYVDCKDLYPDESLDLAAESPYEISPVLDFRQNTEPGLLRFLEVLHFQETDPFNIIQRC
jgi:hypothetical protein